ncbi:MAG: hypothetical protein ACOZEN_15320 [Thermodesulfobacteriota bacterium]
MNRGMLGHWSHLAPDRPGSRGGKAALPAARIFALIAALPLLVLSGCAGSGLGASYAIHLDAYAESVSYGKRFVVLPGIMEMKAGDTDFPKAADTLAKALEAKGYVRAAKLDEADLGIYLAYKVSENDNSPFGNFDQGPAGRHPRQFLFIDYTRDILVEAVDMARYKAGDPKNVVWKIRLVSKGPTSDIHKAMPYVAAAVAHYAGLSTEAYVVVDDSMKVHPYKPEKHGRRP